MIVYRIACSYEEEIKYFFFSEFGDAIDYLLYLHNKKVMILSLLPVKVSQCFIDPCTLKFDFESVYDDDEEEDCGCVVGQEECKKCEHTECTLNERFEY